jgi:hypothetical protein
MTYLLNLIRAYRKRKAMDARIAAALRNSRHPSCWG